jgi:5-methylcytosine-specific restriction endonuclease McrA
MPKVTPLSAERKQEIRDYLLAHPELSMKEASRFFQIPYRRARALFQELGVWKPQPNAKKQRDPELLARLQASWKVAPTNLRQAYTHFLRCYDGAPPFQERTFLRLCEAHGWEFARQGTKVFRKDEFDRIFCDQPQPPVPMRTFRRAVDALLATPLSSAEYLALDPALTKEHLFRYQAIQKQACWCCGKTTHFHFPVPLEIDHISGQDENHRLSNLRLLCPSCHRHTTTHSTQKTAYALHTGSLYSHFDPAIQLDQMQQAFEATRQSLLLRPPA